MRFCIEEQAKYALQMCPEVEDALVHSGIIFIKTGSSWDRKADSPFREPD